MKRLSDIGLTWILTLGFLALGLVIGVNLPTISALHFSPEVDPANVFNGFVILGVGILIDYRYRKLAEAKQSETNLLLNDYRQVKDALLELRVAFEPCQTHQKKLAKAEQIALTAASESMRKKVEVLESGLKRCGVNLEAFEFDSFRSAAEALSEMVTFDPFPGPYGPGDLKHLGRLFDEFEGMLGHMPYRIIRR